METAANQPIKTKRELAMERMQARHPDTDLTDEEAFYGQIVADIDQGDEELAKYKEREKAFSDMFTADPRSAQFMISWRNGEDPAVSFIRQFGMELKDAIDDPERQEALAEANKDFLKRVAKEKEYEEMYQANIAQTLSDLEAVQAEMGLTDEQAEGAIMFLHTIASDGMLGKYSPDHIKMALKAMNHDADVAQAAHEGEVKGRNAKIEEKLRTKQKSDGAVNLDGKNGGVGKKKNLPNLGALSRFADGESIWERGKK